MNNILVTIIIPVYNDWKRLSLCLNALSKQSFAKEDFEIIVVNNDPGDAVPSDYLLSDNCKIITEPKPGSYAARNAAIKISRGKIIGFTDSDCIPDKNWIRNAVKYLSDNNTCSRIAGKIEIFFKSAKPSKTELYDKVFAFNQKGYVHESGTCVTANLFTYLYVFKNIGYFNENLMSGGDFSWGTLAQKEGYKIDYVENVIVNHPARGNLKELIKKEKRVGGSQAIFLKEKSNILVNIAQFIIELRPRRGALKWIFNKGKELSINNKIYIYLLRHYLLGLRAYEKLRVQTGKKANRV